MAKFSANSEQIIALKRVNTLVEQISQLNTVVDNKNSLRIFANNDPKIAFGLDADEVEKIIAVLLKSRLNRAREIKKTMEKYSIDLAPEDIAILKNGGLEDELGIENSED